MTQAPPMWTIGKSQRTDLRASVAPGPGALYYDQHQINPQNESLNYYFKFELNFQNWNFQKKSFSQQFPVFIINKIYLLLSPGPGQYNNHANSREFPKVKIAERFIENTSLQKQIPGVGTYNPKKSNRAYPKYSFGSRMDMFFAEETPGPAAYNYSSVFDMKKCPSSKFGKSQREPLHKTTTKTPAPNNYQNYLPRSSSYECQFGTSVRDSLHASNSKLPGPGHYQTQSQLSRKTTTMISRRLQKTAALMNFPGPGSYQADRLEKFYGIPCSRIGYQLRSDFTTNKTPGPGEYIVRDNYANKACSITHKIGTSERLPLQGKEKKGFPGPGNYEIRKKSLGGPTYYIGKKLSYQPETGGPGPGRYEPVTDFVCQRSSTHLIGTSQRPSLTRTQVTPGPGNYNTQIEGSTYIARIGNSQRQGIEKNSDEPGPGTYDIPSKFADVPAYSMQKTVKSVFD